MSSLPKATAAVMVVTLLAFTLVAPVAAAGPDGTSDGTLDGTLTGGSDADGQSSSANTTDGGSTDDSDDSGTADESSADADAGESSGSSADSPGSDATFDGHDGKTSDGESVDDALPTSVDALTLEEVTMLATSDAFSDASSAAGATAGESVEEGGELASDDGTLPSTLAGLTDADTATTTWLLPSVPLDGGDSEPPLEAAVPDGSTVNVVPVGSDGPAPGDGSIPPAATGGLALGVGAVAAAALTRQSATASLLPGIGATLSAAFAPVVGSVGRPFERLARTLAPFRYSRYDDSDPLEHDARAAVYDIVQETPGAYLSEVSERANIPLSTARHHVRVLEREDLVSGAKLRGKRRFYPAHANGLELAAALNDEATAAVLDAIARLGAASVSDLAGEIDRDPSTISHHLQRLEEDDVIVRERDGRAVLNKLSPEARTALEPEPDAAAPEAEEAVAGAGGAD